MEKEEMDREKATDGGGSEENKETHKEAVLIVLK